MKNILSTPVSIDTPECEPEGRRGVTLVEVLMSLMIMAIGVSSVAVLFPLSVLRSIKATQLTNATILKRNVEVLVDIEPRLIFDPDNDYRENQSLAVRRANLDEHYRSPASRNYIVDPVGFYTHLADGRTAATYGTFGNDGTNPYGVPRWGGGLRATDGRPATNSPAHAAAVRLKALAFANQGDGWDTQIKGPATGLVPGGVQLKVGLDLSQVPTLQLALPSDGNGGYLVADPELYRVVLVSYDLTFSQSFPLVAITPGSGTIGPVAYYTEDINANGALDGGEDVNMNGVLNVRSLPQEFLYDVDGDGTKEFAVSEVRLQSKKVSDYSWMLNVRRRGDGQARSVDVVVRFNDGVSLQDERVFQAVFLPSSTAPPTTSRTVWVRLPSRDTPADSTEPRIRKGGFVFDASNGLWYRIQDVQEAPLFPATGSPFNSFDYLLTVEQEIKSTDGAGAMAGPYGAAMFPSGIVDVFPMGSRNLPESLQLPTF